MTTTVSASRTLVTFPVTEGLNQLTELRAAFEREAEERARAEMDAKRKMIAAARGRFVSVTFTKKDGSERQMRIQPATLKHTSRARQPQRAPAEPLRRVQSVIRTSCPSGTLILNVAPTVWCSKRTENCSSI